MAVVVELICLQRRFGEWKSEVKARECGVEKERSCTNVLFVCVAFAAGICS